MCFLLALILHIYDAYDIVYLDFRKAFDEVLHDKLIIKVRTEGITEAISEWVWKWLWDRTQSSSSSSSSSRRDLGKVLWEVESHRVQCWGYCSSSFT